MQPSVRGVGANPSLGAEVRGNGVSLINVYLGRRIASFIAATAGTSMDLTIKVGTSSAFFRTLFTVGALSSAFSVNRDLDSLSLEEYFESAL